MVSFLEYFSVYALSGLKFIFGPTLGLAYDLPLIATILLTAFGMMSTVYLFTFFGEPIRALVMKFRRRDKVFTKRSRQFVKIWKKYGLKGVCVLTPLVLTPPGGAILVNILERNKKAILKWMWISALFWSAVITITLKYAIVLIQLVS